MTFKKCNIYLLILCEALVCVCVFLFLQGNVEYNAVKSRKARLFWMLLSDKAECSEHKLKQEKFHPSVKNQIYCVVDGRLKQVFQEVVESPSLELFKSHISMILGSLF